MNRSDQPADLPTEKVEVAAPAPVPSVSRRRHELLASIESELGALLGARTRRLPSLIAELRKLL